MTPSMQSHISCFSFRYETSPLKQPHTQAPNQGLLLKFHRKYLHSRICASERPFRSQDSHRHEPWVVDAVVFITTCSCGWYQFLGMASIFGDGKLVLEIQCSPLQNPVKRQRSMIWNGFGHSSLLQPLVTFCNPL